MSMTMSITAQQRNTFSVLFWLVITGACSTNAKQPHILFILADDLGWHDVGYHDSEISTPTLDQLASDGVKLENYYVQPICSPTRSQLLTGRYQIHLGLQHGVIRPSQPNGVPLEYPTIADKLKENGYSTHIVGKWHIGFYKKEYTPTYRGFDSFFGYLIGAEHYYSHKRCVDDKAQGQHRHLCGVDLHENERPVLNESGVYSTHLFTTKAQHLVEQHVASKSTKPLFLYLPFQAVHAPLEVPKEYMERYHFIKDPARRKYAAMVTCMDEGIRNITETFKKLGLWDDTVMIFSSDNGGQVKEGGNNWPLRGAKNTLWEGGMRAVGFVHSRLLPHTQAISWALMHVSDWFPTLLGLAGGSTTDLKLDGFNVWPAISRGTSSPRTELLHNIDPLTPPSGRALKHVAFDTRIRAALRRGKWKLITGNPGPGHWIKPPHKQDHTLYFESFHKARGHDADSDSGGHSGQNLWLFDIRADPEEKHDVSGKFPEVVAEMIQRLAYYNSTAVPVRYPPLDPNADPARHGGVWGPWMT